MLNEIKFKDKLGRKWEIYFPEYIWNIYKGTNPEYIMERLIEVCSNIDECDEYIVNHDTIVAYGIYLTMVQINYEDRFVNVATADYIHRKYERVAHFKFMQNIGISQQDFLGRKHTTQELQLIAGNINESKEPYYKDYYYIPVETNNNTGYIDHLTCFNRSNLIDLYFMFRTMMANFKWDEISELIYKHSIFGMAFSNSVERLAIRDDNMVDYIRPNSPIVSEEFNKLLIKYERKGFDIDSSIKKKFITGS